MPLGVIHACFAHCCDCQLWRYKTDKYRSGKCKFNKHKQPNGKNVACEHIIYFD